LALVVRHSFPSTQLASYTIHADADQWTSLSHFIRRADPEQCETRG
jgi:hypothetical protein